MFIILTYDVKQTRVCKVMKICRKYLRHIQKSVFEGTLTDSKLNKMKSEIERKIDLSSDSVLIYEFESLKFTNREQIGKAHLYTNII